MIDRTCRLIRILLHEADLDQFTLRLAKLHLSHPRRVVFAMCTRFLKVWVCPCAELAGGGAAMLVGSDWAAS
jgi:hypothetical protein